MEGPAYELTQEYGHRHLQVYALNRAYEECVVCEASGNKYGDLKCGKIT